MLVRLVDYLPEADGVVIVICFDLILQGINLLCLEQPWVIQQLVVLDVDNGECIQKLL